MIELGKTYKTRDGREVRVYAIDGGGIYPVHGASKFGNVWQTSWWKADGKSPDRSSRDLIEVKPRIVLERWANVYREDIFDGIDVFLSQHRSRETADKYAGDRIACVKIVIDCEEGEGLKDGR